MSIFNVLRGQFIDIIEWNEPAQNDILAYRFPRANNEIKMGAKLVVREGQAALFVNEGQLSDIFTQAGTYTLSTQNLPILSTLKGWKYGFESPFKAEVYFLSMRQWTDQKWGTQNPIMMRDPEFGPVRVRAFGSYAFHVADPATFLKQLVVTDPMFETFEISNQLRNTIVSRFVDAIGQSKIAVLDLAGNYDRISKVALEVIKPDLLALGLSLTSFLIENISLPPEVEQALDQRTKMGVLGDMSKYTQYQTAQAIGDAAKNPSGMSGLGAGIAAGSAMADQMRNAMAAGAAGGEVASPPLPTSVAFYVAVNNAQQGPFDMGALAGKVRDGSLTRQTLVWKQGMSGWAAAETVGELAGLFGSVPPPLPR
ncbi:MAG TPA: SPFH domain-containing protein [Phycisphaerae bacterium]|nr:SPFH domain-containing protein [Phycisphaerae bacterium]